MNSTGDTPQVTREKVRALNDAFRTHLDGGDVVLTAGVTRLQQHVQLIIVEMIKSFDAFDDDDDPFGKHDFIVVADSRDDECSSSRCCVVFAIDHDARGVGEGGMRLRCGRFGIVVSGEEFVWTR